MTRDFKIGKNEKVTVASVGKPLDIVSTFTEEFEKGSRCFMGGDIATVAEDAGMMIVAD